VQRQPALRLGNCRIAGLLFSLLFITPSSDQVGRLEQVVGFGIIGAGDIARQSFAPALMASTEADLVAVCRRDITQAADFAIQYGGNCAAYGDAKALLADPAVDAVIIATPTHTHAELTLLAAKHGKNVLVEKPMARNQEECQKMIEACQRANVSLGVCYRRRTFPQVVKAKELVAAGAIGEVLTVRTHCSALQDSLKAERDGFSQDWGAEPLLGGAMMEMASHRIEVLLNLMVRLTCMCPMPQHKFPAGLATS
jgi:predicted dehydrogenase